jgi:predicted nucleotidyltransferase
MLTLWQKKPKLNYSKDVLDIIQYGSSIEEGKDHNDIDIAVIFKDIPLEKQLKEAQKIKKQIRKYVDVKVDVNSFSFRTLFDESNFAREGILIYGKSTITGKYFAEKLGFYPRIQIKYNLSKLEKKDKIRFNYMLSGKQGSYGLLREIKGKVVSPGLIEIEPIYKEMIVKNISLFTSDFEVMELLKI